MIQIENVETFGFKAAIHGMRNPLNSWSRSDSEYMPQFDTEYGPMKAEFAIGENDLKLMQQLCKAGSDHRKFLRMINVTADITAPLYWWKEYDTYKVGTVANSCSTMHKLTAKEFTLDDFSCEHLMRDAEGWNIEEEYAEGESPLAALEYTIAVLNFYRKRYLETKDKRYWWQLIQLLPSSYNQRRTVQLNYEVLLNMYHSRKNHKLDEWVNFCKWVETLPYFEAICLFEQ